MDISNQEKLKMIHFLNFICDYEASKPLEEMDEELIDACVKVSLELQDKHVNHSPEFIDEKVRKIFRKEETEKTEPETVKTNKKQINKNKVWLVAACIAILVALFSIISVANDWNVFDFLSEKFGSVHSAPIEEEIEFDGISVIVNNTERLYDSVDEIIEHENLEILFPEYLPEEIKLIRISIHKQNDCEEINFWFKEDVGFSYYATHDNELDNKIINVSNEVLKINNVDFYFLNMPDISQYQAYFSHKGYTYTIAYSDKAELLKILKTIKE